MNYTVGRLGTPTAPPPTVSVDPAIPEGWFGERKPSHLTDAFEDGEHRDNKLIFLGGGIAYWWGERFGSPEHQDYVQWRNDVRATLIEHGYLIYAPHEAFKGTWNKKGQIVNDAAISVSNLVLIISPIYAIGEGTEEEIEFAHRAGVPVDYAPPHVGLNKMLETVRQRAK